MLRRRLQMAGNGGGGLLPPELQACEYLETDGNCYILLDNKVDLYSNFELKGNYKSTASSFYFGMRNGYLDHSFISFRWSNKTGGYTCQISENNEIAFNTNDHSYIYKITGTTMYLYNYDNTLVSSKSISGHQFSSNYNFCLFSCNQAGTILTPCGSGSNIFYCKNENNFDLIACYVKSGKTYTDTKGNICTAGTCGFYDIVNHVFYTNDGSGQFSHGEPIEIEF